MSELSFRFATDTDVPAIVELVESAYRGDAARVGWTHEADLLLGQRTDAPAVAVIVASPKSVLLLAEREGTLIACCQLERHHDFAYFGMFAVRPVLQGGGFGKLVLAEAERIIGTEWGLPEVHMTVVSRRQELISWYQRRGYLRTGKMSPFPYGDERFGIPQFEDLEFELLVKQL